MLLITQVPTLELRNNLSLFHFYHLDVIRGRDIPHSNGTNLQVGVSGVGNGEAGGGVGEWLMGGGGGEGGVGDGGG